MKRGMFITFEGTEASGKTTQIDLLGKYLKEKGEDVVITREPGGTKVGAVIREILLNPKNDGLDIKVEAMLYASSRAQLVKEVIRPALSAKKTVICDRYIDSSLAYQSFGRGLSYEMVLRINQWATDNLVPELTFWLALRPEEASKRKTLDDRMEKLGLEFHKKVYEGYEWLADKFPERIKKIDALLSIEDIHEKVVGLFEEKILKK